MGHKHSVYDSDLHFAINPITRGITNMSSQKTTLIQYDHNSERFTFEIPRYIEGHDMSLCNVVEIHYLNIDAVTKEQNEGIYSVEDLQISPDADDVVILSWLISQNATKRVGSLNFLVRFVCIDNVVPDYVWNTAVFSGISVSSGIFNSARIVTDESDILAHWQRRIEALEQGVLDNFEDGLVVKAVQEQNNLENLMFWSGTKGEYEQCKNALPERVLCLITDDTTMDEIRGIRESIQADIEKLYELQDEVTILTNRYNSLIEEMQMADLTIKNQLKDEIAQVRAKTIDHEDEIAEVKAKATEHKNAVKGVLLVTIQKEDTYYSCPNPLEYDYYVITVKTGAGEHDTYLFSHIQRWDDSTKVRAICPIEEGEYTLLSFELNSGNWQCKIAAIPDYIVTPCDVYGFKYQFGGA